MHVILLAAGRGTRMKSSLPKVLHPVGGLSMIGHTLKTAQNLEPETIVVVLPNGDQVIKSHLESLTESLLIEWDRIRLVYQSQPLGTADAVRAALEVIPSMEGQVLVLNADTPVLTSSTVAKLREAKAQVVQESIWIYAMQPKDPGHYGRVVKADNQRVLAIVEAADATSEERQIGLCNTGVMLVDLAVVKKLLPQIRPTSSKGEFYLTDLVHYANNEGIACYYIEGAEEEFSGVNTKVDLAQAEAILQDRWRKEHMLAGVTLMDPESVYFSYDTKIGPDSVIYPHVVFGPKVQLGGAVTVRPFSMLSECILENDVRVGPCAHLRPGTHLAEGARVGNFVEVKNTRLGPKAHADHLTYLGDTVVGAQAQIGAGTITCNYNGFEKFKTHIDAGAFIGSNTTLVAPVTIGAQAMTAAGSVITKDVAPKSLAFARTTQVERFGYAEIFRKKALVDKNKEQ